MKHRNGFVLITVLLITVVVAILAFGTLFTTMIDRTVTANQQGATEAFYIAQAGLNKYKTVVFQTYRYYLERPEKYEDAVRQGNPACGNYLTIGLDLNRNGVLGEDVDLMDGETHGPFQEGRGEYSIKFETAGRYAVLTAVGRVGRSRSTVQVVSEPKNVGLLSHALFAGPGQSSKFLNGNVEIYGGVHIVGDSANPDAYVIDANGNFMQYNYYGMNQLEDVVKDAKITGQQLQQFLSLNAHEQRDLCATLRVEHGRIRLGGSASVGGEPPNLPASNGFKTNIASASIGTGPSSLDSGTISRMHADELRNFDMDTSPPFPGLDDSNLELNDDCEAAEAGTWRDCIHATENLYTFTAQGPTIGNVCTNASGAAITDFSPYISSNVLTFSEMAITCTSRDVEGNDVSGFRYTKIVPEPSKGAKYRLEVFGITNFKGLDLSFTKDVQVRFENQATFFVEREGDAGGDVTIAGDLLPSQSFPDQDVIGMIMDGTLRMTGDNQQTTDTPKEQVAMGLFYAGEAAEIVQGGIVFGTVIAPTFTFSSGNAGQTSKIVQVPGLTYGSAPGFNKIKDDAKATFRVASFERR